MIDRCPNPNCKWHVRDCLPRHKWFRRHGSYESSQHKEVKRFVCRNCGKTFSERTGNENWYLHRDDIDSAKIAFEWVSGKSLKAIARNNGCSQQTIRTRLKRRKTFI